MKEKRQILCAEEFQIIYIDALLSGRGSTSPHSLSVGCVEWLPSKEEGVEGAGEGVTLRWNLTGDQGQHPQWRHADNTYLSHSGMRMALWLWDLSPSNPYPRLSESESEVAQSCPTLCDPMDCSLPGSSIHRIFQASILEWGAIASSMKRNYQTLTVLEGKEITKPSLAFLLHIRKKGTYVKRKKF